MKRLPPPTQAELDATRDQMLAHLERVAEKEIMSSLIRVLGQGDIIMLSALGIDARVKMLDVFIAHSQKLKTEILK